MCRCATPPIPWKMQPQPGGELRRALLCPDCGHTRQITLSGLAAEAFDYDSSQAKLLNRHAIARAALALSPSCPS